MKKWNLYFVYISSCKQLTKKKPQSKLIPVPFNVNYNDTRHFAEAKLWELKCFLRPLSDVSQTKWGSCYYL